MKETKAVDLGKLQTEYESSKRLYDNSEKALKKAQDLRDSAKANFTLAETALKDATRTVLG